MPEQIRRITLLVTDDEMCRLMDLIRTDSELFDTLTRRLVAEVNGKQPAPPEPIRRNGLEFATRADYEDHRKFYKQAMSDFQEILRGGGER